jgi:hypothetical protein
MDIDLVAPEPNRVSRVPTRRRGWVIASVCLGALVVAAATTQLGSSNTDTDTAERRTPTAIQLDDQPITSALHDGTELQHAINQALDQATTTEQQPSALLDGTELQHARGVRGGRD